METHSECHQLPQVGGSTDLPPKSWSWEIIDVITVSLIPQAIIACFVAIKLSDAEVQIRCVRFTCNGLHNIPLHAILAMSHESNF